MASSEQTPPEQERRDFFISYTGKDRTWAEWIAMQLEEAKYTTIIQAWDFRPGSNFVASMDDAATRAERTLLVLSSAYLKSGYTFAEWAVAFHDDPMGQQGRVLPVRIEPCEVKGLLGSIVYIDLVDFVDEQQAREHLLAGVQQGRAKPTSVPFPALQSKEQQSPREHPAFPGALPSIWNVPYPCNMLFTGREALLEQLAANLRTGEPTALSQPQAISGLGGIGKTQLALEYAYRYRHDYQAVLWAQADTRENLTTWYLALARLLALPERDVSEAEQVIAAVKRWLQTHAGWLFILDNADELALVEKFIPPAFRGHLLLTTRAQTLGKLARKLEVDVMRPEIGALLLLRRSKQLAPEMALEQASPAVIKQAQELAQELGGLPLALDQAAAYVDETQCSLERYLQLYRARRALLLQRRGELVDHPESVATTLLLSLEKAEHRSSVAVKAMRLCAYLSPDAIPEELFTIRVDGREPVLAPVAADDFELDEAIAALGAYSLVSRDRDAHTLSIHRLVQAVLVDSMTQEDRQQWAERAVLAVNAAFPGPDVKHASWPQCERLLPHALVAAQLIEQEQITRPEAARLLNQTGYYLKERARYQEAEPLLKRALDIREQQLGPEHLDTAQSLSNLGSVYSELGKYKEAEPLYRRCLEIRERSLGSEDPAIADPLNNLAILCKVQGKYKEAEPLYRGCLELRKRHLGSRHPDVAKSFNNLAVFYAELGKYEEYEVVKRLGLDPHMQKKTLYEEAEQLFCLSLAIREQTEPPDPDTAQSLSNLANLCTELGRYEEAQWHYQRCFERLLEQRLGPEHPEFAYCLNGCGLLCMKLGYYDKAKWSFEESLRIWKQGLGCDHPQVAYALNNLGMLASVKGDYEEAKHWYQRGLKIFNRSLGSGHLHTQTCAWSLCRAIQKSNC